SEKLPEISQEIVNEKRELCDFVPVDQLPRPWIRESRVVEHVIVRERLEECDQIDTVLAGQAKATDPAIFIRILAANAGVRPIGYGAATGGVVIQNLVQRGDTAVVH